MEKRINVDQSDYHQQQQPLEQPATQPQRPPSSVPPSAGPAAAVAADVGHRPAVQIQYISAFRLFTKESMSKIERRIRDERRAREQLLTAQNQRLKLTDGGGGSDGCTGQTAAATAGPDGGTTGTGAAGGLDSGLLDDEKREPNPLLQAGSKLPAKLGVFPPELYGKPIEDLDDYYQNQYVFMVVARDGTIFRFSATHALFILSPFNPIRRFAIYVLTHPLIVMVVILINCVFMAIKDEIPKTEETFTGIYTVESTIKVLARGFILTRFTYLRDAWNWLDFIVVSLAYITMAFPLGNLAALRTFRVLRALKTVAVVPGLKTIVGALMEAVRRLRDVMILTVFVLSIFALVGLQLYQGSLRNKCVRLVPSDLNSTEEERFRENRENWYKGELGGKLCESDSQCPTNFTCIEAGQNPNYGYTNFDNFGWALLCAFRLMTQDYWESLYQMVIRANGTVHMLFFIIVIFMGSFYLVNLILAIVAMSYDDCQKLDKEDEEAEEEEEMLAEEERLRAANDEAARARMSSVSGGGRRVTGCWSVDDDASSNYSDELLDDVGPMGYGGRRRRQSTALMFGGVYNALVEWKKNDRRTTLLKNFVSSKSTDCVINLDGERIAERSDNRKGFQRSRSLPTSPQGISKPRRLKSNAPLGTWTRPLLLKRHQYPESSNVENCLPDGRFYISGVQTRPGGLTYAPAGANQAHCLDALNLPYVDESHPTTPTLPLSEEFPAIQESTFGGTAAAVNVKKPIQTAVTVINGNTSACQTVAVDPRPPVRNRIYSISAAASTSSSYATGPPPPALPRPSIKRYSVGSGLAVTGYRCSIIVAGPVAAISPPAASFGGRIVATGIDGGVGSGGPRRCEPTHFHWTSIGNATAVKARSSAVTSSAGETQSGARDLVHTTTKLFVDNPYICDTPSPTTAVDINDVLVLKDLFSRASRKTSRQFPRYWYCNNDGVTCKEYIRAKCLNLMFGWDCTPGWYHFAHFLELFIMDAFVDLFITLCIVINTVFMAMDHAGMSEQMTNTLAIGNYVFTAIFTAEAALKIMALGLYKYLQDKWSCFDIIIVLLSLVELGLANVKGLTILRSFRLLRVFKLAKSWPTLNLLIGIIGRTMGALGNLCFVLAIIVFIFAVMGMQLFGANYVIENFDMQELRWHFGDFLHSFMIVFRVLCGEWIESMWDCIHCTGFQCIPFFLLTMIIGNLVVLNLFLALLLSSFGAESLKHSQEDSEPNKLQEAVDRINRFVIYFQSKISQILRDRYGGAGGGLNQPIVVTSRDSINTRHQRQGVAHQNNRNHNNHHHATVRSNNATVKAYDVTGAGGDGKTSLGSENMAISGSDIWSPISSNHKCRANDLNCNTTVAVHNNHVSRRISTANRSTNKLHIAYSPVPPYELQVDVPDTKESAAPPPSYEALLLERRSSSSRDHSSAARRTSTSMASSVEQRSQSRSRSRSRTASVSSSSVSSLSAALFHSDSNNSLSQAETASVIDLRTNDAPEINEVNVVFVKYPDECCPVGCKRRCRCCQVISETLVGRVWWRCRCMIYQLVEHKYFETFIIAMILASSLALAVEDKELEKRETLKKLLKHLDRSFTIIFVVEMVIKQMAYGFKKYFTDAWCWLDFVIVGISMVSLGAEGAGLGNIGAFRALRTLRALRPLRAVSRWEGMKVVVNALIQAIPAIFNVLLVCLVFWLIFSIMGVNLFGGRFRSCVDSHGNLVNVSIVANDIECLNKSSYMNLTWKNPQINFDNVLSAYLALFQVATFKGWIDIMNDAIDSRTEIGLQPIYEGRVFMYLYFVFFIVFGSFFTLNLFIGVIIDNFNMQKKKAGGSLEMFMTEDQKKYYSAMKKLGSKRPQKPIPKPKLKCQLFFFKLTTNQNFDIVIMIVILLNMTTMAMEHHGQPKQLTTVLNFVNQLFIAVFTMECVMKLLGLRLYYFKQPWNVFDFCVVVMSILGQAMSGLMENLVVSPTLLRVVRVFRVGRILRLVKSAKGIRTLLFSLAVSLPALFNIGLLLFLIMFIYAIFGMSFFMHVRHTRGISDMFNFETFDKSVMLLFQVSTSAGWDAVLGGLMNDDCNGTATEDSPYGDCGNSGLAVMYLVTYLVITFLVVINMYIAVILENFSQATEDVQQGLTQDDIDMYYEVWERYDEKATQYIPLEYLSEFVSALEEPLRIPQPNFYRLVVLDIPICQDDLVHCIDILDALTKNFLGANSEMAAGELGEIKKGPERVDYHPISSLMKRQREIFAATVIQKAWSAYLERRRRAEGGGLGLVLPATARVRRLAVVVGAEGFNKTSFNLLETLSHHSSDARTPDTSSRSSHR